MPRKVRRNDGPVEWDARLAKRAMAEYVLDLAAELLAVELEFSKDRARRLLITAIRQLDD